MQFSFVEVSHDISKLDFIIVEVSTKWIPVWQTTICILTETIIEYIYQITYIQATLRNLYLREKILIHKLKWNVQC